MSGTLNPYRHQYEVVPPSTTQQILGGTGAVGDFLHRINVNNTISSVVNLYDGAILVISAVISAGVYNYEFNMASQNGAWKVTTSSGATVIGIGTFTN